MRTLIRTGTVELATSVARASCPLDGTAVNVTSQSVIRAMLTSRSHQFQMCRRRSFGSSSR
eukprot:scaffold8551_cov621-Pinguiococcus_pyrenoidosus.AAC.1